LSGRRANGPPLPDWQPTAKWIPRVTYTLYHNPRCGKSRQTLELLRGRGIEPAIVEYLKTPPTRRNCAGYWVCSA